MRHENRLAKLEQTIRAITDIEYAIKINNITVEIKRLICPGNTTKTIIKHESPYHAVMACQEFIRKRGKNFIPNCQFDNFMDLYPEVKDDFPIMHDMIYPYYGERKSIFQYALRHILLYHHTAAFIYGADHNAYAARRHPAEHAFEQLMQAKNAEQSQADLLAVLLAHSKKMRKEGVVDASTNNAH